MPEIERRLVVDAAEAVEIKPDAPVFGAGADTLVHNVDRKDAAAARRGRIAVDEADARLDALRQLRPRVALVRENDLQQIPVARGALEIEPRGTLEVIAGDGIGHGGQGLICADIEARWIAAPPGGDGTAILHVAICVNEDRQITGSGG